VVKIFAFLDLESRLSGKHFSRASYYTIPDCLHYFKQASFAGQLKTGQKKAVYLLAESRINRLKFVV